MSLRPLLRSLLVTTAVVSLLGDAATAAWPTQLDFTAGTYRVNGIQAASFLGLPGASYVRAGSAYAETAAGGLTAFAANVPRITDKGLLVEEARTNLLTYSQDFDNAAWAKSNIATAGSVTAPDGTNTALAIDEGVVAGSSHTLTASATVVAATVYTMSVYAKAGTRSTIQIAGSNTGSAFGLQHYANFDLSNGTVGTVGTNITASGCVAMANGWYRCWIAGPAITSAGPSAAWVVLPVQSVAAVRAESYTGTSKVFYAWGAQLEAGALPSSYIPTTSAAATRGADNASVGGLTLPAAYALLASATLGAENGSTQYLAGMSTDTGDANNRIFLLRSSGGNAQSAVVFGGANSLVSASKTGARTVTMAQSTTGNGTWISSFDGATQGTFSTTLPASMTRLSFGRHPTGLTGQANGYIRKVLLGPALDQAALNTAAT